MKTLTLSSLRYLFLASSVSLLPLVALSSKASAQTAASTTVTATVTGVLLISAPASKSFTVGNTANSVDIGSVNVRSNQKNGYQVKVYSTNGGKMKNTGTDQFSYTLSATSGLGTQSTGVTPGTNSASGATLYSSLNFQNEKCPLDSGCDIGINLNYSAGVLDSVPPDSYTDTITYEVSAK